jgi:hypothetical protein
MSRYRTQEALTLERILAGSHRYLFCWNGEQGEQAYDCACCITYLTDEILCSCGCACHERIDTMARSASATLWLRALAAMNELPPFFSSEDEKVAYLEAHPHNRGCECEDCLFLARVIERKAQEARDKSSD